MALRPRKPLRANPETTRAWQDRSKPLSRGEFWTTRSGQLKRRTALAKRNVQRAAKRTKVYRTVIASDFHKQLRYTAFLRSGGLCECESCALIRRQTGEDRRLHRPDTLYAPALVEMAFASIPVWFTKRGAEPWQRFRSTDGELHHTSYRHFGAENLDELRLVQWVWRDCHQRIEAEHGTRRTFLRGPK